MAANIARCAFKLHGICCISQCYVHPQKHLFRCIRTTAFCSSKEAEEPWSRSSIFGTFDNAKEDFGFAGSFEDDEHTEDIKERILSASLSFVNEHGWTKHTLIRGTQSIGYPAIAHGLFPNGGIHLITYFYQTSNNDLQQVMKQWEKEKTQMNKAEFLQDAVKFRLRMIIPYLERWPEAIAIMSRPQNINDSIKNLTKLMDDIWYYAGDRSLDFHWYTRRVALAGVYKSTELSMLQDKSDDYTDTWRFLGRRIREMQTLGTCVENVSQSQKALKEILGSSLITAENIFGIRRKQ